MRQVQFKKIVAVCLLEAVKVTLEQLAKRRLEFPQGWRGGDPDLTRMYGAVRRLRDYMQRGISSGREFVAFELDDGHAALLVGCCRRMVDVVERRLEHPDGSPDERGWLNQKIRMLSEQAVEFAAKPLVELPLGLLGKVGPRSRELTARIRDKVFGPVEHLQKIRPPQSRPASRAQGLASFGDRVVGDSAAANGMTQLIDRSRIRDPRLRGLVAIDLKSLQRAQREGDFRVASVLLASVAEAVVLDHLSPRRVELGLSGTPDSWDLVAAMLRAMGDAALPKDERWCRSLFTTRNVLRPARQIVAPFVATASSFDGLRRFVARLFHVLGYTSAGSDEGGKLGEALPEVQPEALPESLPEQIKPTPGS